MSLENYFIYLFRKVIAKFIEYYNRLYSPTNMSISRCDVCSHRESLKECNYCKSTCCSEHCRSRNLCNCKKCKNSTKQTILLHSVVRRLKYIVARQLHLFKCHFLNICTECHAQNVLRWSRFAKSSSLICRKSIFGADRRLASSPGVPGTPTNLKCGQCA